MEHNRNKGVKNDSKVFVQDAGRAGLVTRRSSRKILFWGMLILRCQLGMYIEISSEKLCI